MAEGVSVVDAYGHITLLPEHRKALNVWIGDQVDMTLDGQQIVITKSQPSCIFCGATDSLREFRGKHVCSKCLGYLKRTKPPKPYIPFDQCV